MARVFVNSGALEVPSPMPPLRPVVRARPITVGRDVWIGGGGISDGTVVGAGSVMTRSLPGRVVAAGNPARVIRSVDGAA